MLRDLHSDPALRDLIEEEEDRLDRLDRERVHDDREFELAEFVSERVRRRYRAQEAFDNG